MEQEPSAMPTRPWREIAYELIREKDRSKVLVLMNELSLAVGDDGAEDAAAEGDAQIEVKENEAVSDPESGDIGERAA